jgi:hypothetical protein
LTKHEFISIERKRVHGIHFYEDHQW